MKIVPNQYKEKLHKLEKEFQQQMLLLNKQQNDLVEQYSRALDKAKIDQIRSDFMNKNG